MGNKKFYKKDGVRKKKKEHNRVNNYVMLKNLTGCKKNKVRETWTQTLQKLKKNLTEVKTSNKSQCRFKPSLVSQGYTGNGGVLMLEVKILVR